MKKSRQNEIDYYLGKPRLEMAGSECLVDGLKSVIEYSDTKISVSLGSQIIVFNGFDLRINSFTKDGAIIEGNITNMEFLS
jgi:sporulation protein YqfC